VPASSPKLTPDVFSVSRRFDMATILVAMVGYAILFGLLRQIPNFPPWAIGAFGLFFAVVAIGQGVAIRWNNPRAASVIAGTVYWIVLALVIAAMDTFRNPCELLALIVSALFVGPITGYLAGTLVGGVFLISHYLRESNGLRRRAPAEEDKFDSPWGVTPTSVPPDDDYDWPVMIEVPPEEK
jgi:hypothetical protein